jgi:Tol biopolymer transport system component
MTRWLTRLIIGTLALVPLLALSVLGTDGPSRAQSQLTPYSGELFYLWHGDAWRLDLATNESRLFLHPSAGHVTHLVPAPDRRRVAYAIDVLDSTSRLQSSEISVADGDGTNAQAVVREAGEGYRVGWLSWPSDPLKLVYSKENPARGVERIEEVDLATGERTLLLEGGSSPYASPTQPLLAYATPAGNRWTIWALDRQSDIRREVVRASWFDDADNPAFSPDGSLIAFVAAGSGPATAPTLQEIFMDLGRPRPASAHNLLATFFDLWVVRPDGGGLRRVAQLLDLQPEFTWSPDGRHIAAMGTLQLQIVDVESGESWSVPRPSGKGKLSWSAGPSGP